MVKMKKLLVLCVILATLLSMAGCGGGSVPTEVMNAEAPQATEAPAMADAQAAYDNGSGYYEGESAAAGSGEASTPEGRKIIQNASLDIETDDASAFYDNLAAYAEELGGWQSSCYISNYDEYSVINAEIKVPPQKLSAFIKYAGDNGKIVNSSLSSEDITESYYDIETRLETKRKALQAYYDLLENASTVEEIVYIQRTIDSLTEDIEAYEGKLKVWDSLVDMATVTLYIRQDNDPVKIQKEISWDTLTLSDMGYLIKSGLVRIMNVIVSVLQWILIALIVASPFLIIALIVFLIVRKVRKKRGYVKPAKKDRPYGSRTRNKPDDDNNSGDDTTDK